MYCYTRLADVMSLDLEIYFLFFTEVFFYLSVNLKVTSLPTCRFMKLILKTDPAELHCLIWVLLSKPGWKYCYSCAIFLLIIFKWNWDNCCIWLCTTDFRALVIIVLNLWFHDNMFCFAPVCWAFSFHILVFLLLEFCTSIQCRWT